MLKKLFILLAIAFIAAPTFAQAGFDDDVTDVAVPVDGGITFIVGGAIALGFKASRKK